MRRCYLQLSLSLVMIGAMLALAGCARRPVTISLMVFGDPAERQAYADLVAAFHEAQPEISVELRHIPAQEAYRTRLASDFAAGAPPDVFLLNYRRYAAFAADGLLEPLEPYLEESPHLDVEQFYPLAIEAFRWRGELICLPQNISTLVVYYNQDLFHAAGVPRPADDWTWDDFVAAARALTVDRDGDGVAEQYGLGVEPSLLRLAPFVWMNGGPLVDDGERPTRLALTRPPAQEALDWFVALRQEHGVAPGRVEELAQDSESRFLAGTTAMYLNSRRGTPTYREIAAFSWDVAPLPRGQSAATVLHSDGYCLARATDQTEAAWRFIEFANSVEGQTLVARSGRTVPSLREVAESPAFLDPGLAPAHSQVFLDSARVARFLPVVSTWDEIERVADEEIARAFYGEISSGEAARLAVERTQEYFLMADFAYVFPTLRARGLCAWPVTSIVRDMAESRRIIASFRTDQGRTRETNQDFVAWREPDSPEATGRDGWLYVLADGAGGMDAGEVASSYATERTLAHYLDSAGEDDWGLRLHRAMLSANRDLRQLSASQATQNRMATTMVAAVIAGDRAYIGNVGDSRAYFWRKGELQQVTRDQSLIAKLLEEGAITAEEAATHPRRNVILYSLGSERDPRIDLYELALEPGDQLLLCSDGLTRHVADEELAIVLGEQDPDEATAALVRLANERGGQDNISVGVLRVEGTLAKSRPRVVKPVEATPAAAGARTFLLAYTLFLSLVQTMLISVLWFSLLR